MAEYELKVHNYGGIEEPGVEYDNFKTGVMNPRDILANILRNVKDPDVAGVTYGFQGDKLILTINIYEFPSNNNIKDMVATMNEVIKWLKKKYKEQAGKTLKLKKISDSYDIVAAYTTDKKAKLAYSMIFDISGNKDESEMNSLDSEYIFDEKRKPDFKFV